jgi:D-xylose transport system substrate-binding protein
MFRKVCRLFIIPSVLAMLLLAGCSPRHGTSAAPKKRPLIGFSMDTLKEERWYRDKETFEEEVKKQNADVLVSICYEDSAKQLQQVKQMVSQGVDVLVIIPHDAVEAASAVSYAKQHGVKVISYDRLVRNAGVDLYISFDNEKVGNLQASAITQKVGNGNYVIIKGPASDYNTVMIKQGIMSVLNPYMASGNIKVVKQVEAYDWMADEAYDCILSLHNEGVKIDAVIAENDALAGGAIDALSECQMIPSVPVVGMDADLAACQRVVEGQQYMTVYKPIRTLATMAAKIAVKMAKQESIRADDQIHDGTKNVPYIKIEPIAVYKDNMVSTVIKDGFHTMEEVYMNVPKEQWPQN